MNSLDAFIRASRYAAGLRPPSDTNATTSDDVSTSSASSSTTEEEKEVRVYARVGENAMQV